MRVEADREALNLESSRLVWVLDKLAKDPTLHKQTDFGKLMHQFNYYEG